MKKQSDEHEGEILWHALSGNEALQGLSSGEQGLSSEEAARRLHETGLNQISRKRGDGIGILLWRQINNPLIWVLLASGALAILLGKLTDGSVVLAVVLINAVIGCVQEFKAGRAIEALSDMVPRTATVLRDGKKLAVPAAELVPGDLVLLDAGDSVPADMRLLSVRNLRVEEAALTGESVPVEKETEVVPAEAALADRACMVYSGTLVSAGNATAVVTGTGMATELGRISALLSQTVDLDTPLTKKLAELSLYITIGIALITAVILAAGLYRAVSQGMVLAEALKETLIFAIALAVGAIPEGLPAVVTIALAIGVRRMARRNAIVRKLPAVETLGGTTVICTDKTGTLTCNAMTVTEILSPEERCQISGIGYAPEGAFSRDGQPVERLSGDLSELLLCAALCNDAGLGRGEDGAPVISGDPTEAALLVAAAKAGMEAEALRKDWPRLDVFPFSSENRYMATLHAAPDGKRRLILKGAPEAVLDRCRVSGPGGEVSRRMSEEVNRMGEQGMRVLALAEKTLPEDASGLLDPALLEGGFRFLGLTGMIDPPREEARQAIAVCQRAGITVKMITGDHRTTALAIGTGLGLTDAAGQALTGPELSAMNAEELRRAAGECNIFARVAPEHKLALVQALQSEKQVAAMTGDGVNDAPALKQADIGVAMGLAGTAVSREAADIVLADDNFASIAAAVEEGRRVYDNLIKSLAFLLPTNLGLALILMYGILFFPFDPVSKTLLLPMLPSQLLWINLVAAVALALPLAFEVREPDSMRRPPRRPDAPLFNGFVVFRLVTVSVLMTAGTILVFTLEYRGWTGGMAEEEALRRAQTMAVTFVILFQIFYMLHCRSLKEGLFTIGLFSNPTVFPGAALVLALHALFIYLPFMQRIFRTEALPVEDLALTAGCAFLILPLVSCEKGLRSWWEKRGGRRREVPQP